jgi:hypothetical protein
MNFDVMRSSISVTMIFTVAAALITISCARRTSHKLASSPEAESAFIKSLDKLQQAIDAWAQVSTTAESGNGVDYDELEKLVSIYKSYSGSWIDLTYDTASHAAPLGFEEFIPDPKSLWRYEIPVYRGSPCRAELYAPAAADVWCGYLDLIARAKAQANVPVFSVDKDDITRLPRGFTYNYVQSPVRGRWGSHEFLYEYVTEEGEVRIVLRFEEVSAPMIDGQKQPTITIFNQTYVGGDYRRLSPGSLDFLLPLAAKAVGSFHVKDQVLRYKDRHSKEPAADMIAQLEAEAQQVSLKFVGGHKVLYQNPFTLGKQSELGVSFEDAPFLQKKTLVAEKLSQGGFFIRPDSFFNFPASWFGSFKGKNSSITFAKGGEEERLHNVKLSITTDDGTRVETSGTALLENHVMTFAVKVPGTSKFNLKISRPCPSVVLLEPDQNSGELGLLLKGEHVYEN